MRLIELDRAAEIFKVSRRTISRKIAAGELTRYSRAGSRRSYVELSELRRVFAMRAVPPARKPRADD